MYVFRKEFYIYKIQEYERISKRDLVKLAATVGITSAIPLMLTSATQQTAQKTATGEVKVSAARVELYPA